ncbi:MAG: glyoxalase/bleomycin resistance/extradiol dioxygenase family protein [Rhizomicrobium sp.]
MSRSKAPPRRPSSTSAPSPPPSWRAFPAAGGDGRLIHCHLHLHGHSLMLSDPFPEHGHAYKEPAGVTLHLQVDDIDTWFRRAVEAGCTVLLPVSKQFWGDLYGQLKDPFGIAWSLGETPKS